MKKYLEAFVKEMVPMTIGLLLALLINNWNENRKDEKYIDQMFSSIEKELGETNENIISNLVSQESLVDTIDLYVNNDQVSLLDLVIKAEGIYMPPVKLNSWKAIANSKIELIEYAKLSAFSNIEEQNDILKMKASRFVDFIYANAKDTGKDKKEFMKILMSDIIDTEKIIQQEIEKIVKK